MLTRADTTTSMQSITMRTSGYRTPISSCMVTSRIPSSLSTSPSASTATAPCITSCGKAYDGVFKFAEWKGQNQNKNTELFFLFNTFICKSNTFFTPFNQFVYNIIKKVLTLSKRYDKIASLAFLQMVIFSHAVFFYFWEQVIITRGHVWTIGGELVTTSKPTLCRVASATRLLWTEMWSCKGRTPFVNFPLFFSLMGFGNAFIFIID